MTYDEKYDSMPLRGKISIDDAMRREWGETTWAYDYSRRAGRKHHRHYDPWTAYFAVEIIGAYDYVWSNPPSKGHKRKTWKDFY